MRIETNSSLACFSRCARKYYYRYELKLTPIDDPKALRIGRIVHDAISKYLTGMNPVDVERFILDSFRDGQAELIDVSILSENESVSVSCFRRYVDTFGVDRKITAIENEFVFNVVHPFTGETLETKIAGKIDGMFQINGRDWIIEHKTVSSIQSYVEKLLMHPQVLTYLTAFPNAEGVAFNLIQKKELPEKPKVLKSGKGLSIDKRQNTTYRLFVEAIQENGFNLNDYDEILDSLRNREADVVRHYITYSEEIRNQFQVSLYETVKKLEVTAAIGNWSMNFHSCNGSYGKCQFFDVCNACEKDGMIQALFRVRDQKHEELTECGGVK